VAKQRQKCEAYKAFEKNVARSEAFLRLFDVDRGKGQPSNDEKELLRGAVVFAIGSLDAFLHELVLEIVPTFGGNRAALADALRAIAKEDPGLSLRMALAPDTASKTDEFRSALDDWLERKSFQGAAKVSAALGYIGCDLDLSAFDQHTGVKTAERLEHYTKMRHDIVHRGLKPQIVRSSAGECVRLIEEMGKVINQSALQFYTE
jgi:hypothetical protein